MWVLYCMHSFGCWLQCNNCLNAMYGKIMQIHVYKFHVCFNTVGQKSWLWWSPEKFCEFVHSPSLRKGPAGGSRRSVEEDMVVCLTPAIWSSVALTDWKLFTKTFVIFTLWLTTARSEARQGQPVISQRLIHIEEQWRRKLQMLSAKLKYSSLCLLSPSVSLSFPVSSLPVILFLRFFLQRAAAQTTVRKVCNSPLTAASKGSLTANQPHCSWDLNAPHSSSSLAPPSSRLHPKCHPAPQRLTLLTNLYACMWP